MKVPSTSQIIASFGATHLYASSLGSLSISFSESAGLSPQDRNDTQSIPFRSIRESEVAPNQECLFVECHDFRNLEIYCKGPPVRLYGHTQLHLFIYLLVSPRQGIHPDKKRILQYEDQKTLRRELKAHVGPQAMGNLFAFQNKERFESLEAEVKGWPIYEVHREATRWKLPKDEVAQQIIADDGLILGLTLCTVLLCSGSSWRTLSSSSAPLIRPASLCLHS